MIKQTIEIQKGVYLASAIDVSFSNAYLKIREKEMRVYKDQIVKQFPYTEKKHPQHHEWQLRQKSTDRFIHYLNAHPKKTLLEIGCGNGWFTNICANRVDCAIGIDINLPELEQASSLFKEDGLRFAYWNVFSESPFTETFDVIVLNAVVQYFPDIEILKNRLLELLSPKGELHIIDSPFYEEKEISLAQQRSKVYYSKMDVPEMTDNYYHHSKKALDGFEPLYTPSSSKIKQLLQGKDMPFGWYRFKA